MMTLLLLLAVPVPAQVVRAPALSRPVLSAPLAAPRLAAPALSPALAAPKTPVLSVPVLAQPRLIVPVAAKPLGRPQDLRGGTPSAYASVAAAVETITAARGDAAKAAPALDGLYESRLSGAEAVAVPGLAAAPRPALSARSVNAVTRSGPPAPRDPAWKRVGRALGRTAGTAFGLWGGLQAGDLAYGLALGGTGAVGLVLSAAALSGAAWLLRRRESSLGSRLTWGAMLASATFTITGQLLWDVTGLPWLGLGAGLILGAALALYSGGFGNR